MISYFHSDAYSPYIGLLKTYDLDGQKYYLIYAMLESAVDIVSHPQVWQHILSILPNSKFFWVPEKHHKEHCRKLKNVTNPKGYKFPEVVGYDNVANQCRDAYHSHTIT